MLLWEPMEHTEDITWRLGGGGTGEGDRAVNSICLISNNFCHECLHVYNIHTVQQMWVSRAVKVPRDFAACAAAVQLPGFASSRRFDNTRPSR